MREKEGEWRGEGNRARWEEKRKQREEGRSEKAREEIKGSHA